MKKIILFSLIIVLAQSINAQITLDVIYPGAKQKLYMVNLEVSGMKYVVKNDDQGNRFLKLYNLNHSLWKTINCNPFPTTPVPGPVPGQNYNFDAVCISEKVFDCDNDIEFMYVSNSGSHWFTGIYKENGTALLIADSMAPLIKMNVPNQYKPMYNTTSGTKLILSHIAGSARVYSLPCSLTTGLELDKAMQDPTVEPGMNVYPNPSFYESTISYKLPKDVNTAEIIIYDVAGKEIKRYNVDNTFSTLLIEQAHMAPGTYVYTLVAQGKNLDSKKIILNPR